MAASDCGSGEYKGGSREGHSGKLIIAGLYIIFFRLNNSCIIIYTHTLTVDSDYKPQA